MSLSMIKIMANTIHTHTLFLSLTTSQIQCYSLHETESVSHLAISTLQPHGLQPARLLCPWDAPVKNTGVGSHSLLQGIFSTPRIKPGSPPWQAESLQSEPSGKTVNLSVSLTQTVNSMRAGTRSALVFILQHLVQCLVVNKSLIEYLQSTSRHGLLLGQACYQILRIKR